MLAQAFRRGKQAAQGGVITVKADPLSAQVEIETSTG
jgi:hypothetical protein